MVVMLAKVARMHKPVAHQAVLPRSLRPENDNSRYVRTRNHDPKPPLTRRDFDGRFTSYNAHSSGRLGR